MKEPRSIIFYAWAGLAVQSLLAAGVIAFVLAGAVYQRAATATHLTYGGDAMVARSQPILGVGLGWGTAILAAGLLLPAVALAAGLRWAGVPLHAATAAVRRRALGDTEARAIPEGPAEVRDLASSFNVLANESDRARAREHERARLHADIGRASARIREHLRGQAIVKEAVTAIREHLVADFVWVGMVNGVLLSIVRADQDAWGQLTGTIGHLSPDSVDWMGGIYRHRTSYLVKDLHSSAAAEIPAEARKTFLGLGAASLLFTPFGAGQELLGCLALARADPGHAWAQPEIEAVESLAGDIGRALEHARLYEGEERLVAELKSLDQAKSSFLAAASHDVRTPLTSILGYVELMSDGEAGPVTPRQAKMLDAMNRNARRLRTMVEDMLTVSKIELGAFTSRLRPLDLTSLVRAAADVIRPSTATGGIVFAMNCPDHALMVDGDPEQLDRVLANLLSNAVKYTPKGGNVTLTVQGAGECAELTVADTGIGIPEEDQASLFTRFFRASNAVEAAIQGSGLGLSIVRTIVTNHHGDLSVESARDRGTAVTVRIPLHSR